MRFEQSDQAGIFLLHGEVGAGKTSAARLSQQRAWTKWTNDKKEDNNGPGTTETKLWVPLFIELKQISEAKDFLTERLLASPCHYTLAQIQHLREHYKFMFIFDGWDECPRSSERDMVHDIELPHWTAKLLISTRTEWLNKAVAARNALKKNLLNSKVFHLTECYISPFNQKQIDNYLQQCFASNAHENCWETYRDFLMQQSELYRMAASPVMLHILCSILPQLVANKQATRIYTRVGLYEMFLDAWFEREICKERTLSALPALPYDELKQKFLDYTQNLAFTMLCESKLMVERSLHKSSRMMPATQSNPDAEVAKKDPWAYFFDDKDPIVQRAQRTCPLSLERTEKDGLHYHRYQFIHKSFVEHAASTVLWEALREGQRVNSIDACLPAWNHRYLTEERGILGFLLERLTHASNRAQLEDHLLAMVLASRGNPSAAKAASSAITLLNQAAFAFYNRVPKQDLSGIRVPHADLSGCHWMDLDCTDIDVSEVTFHNAVLVGAKLYRANLKGAHFLKGSSFIMSEGWLQAMALHPTRPGIVAYVDGGDKPLKIAMARLADGHIEKRLADHKNNISCFTFRSDGLLASGSWRGTTHLWDTDQAAKTFLNTLEGHSEAVRCLAFSPTGSLLASGGSDATVCLWDTTCPEKASLLTTLLGHSGWVNCLAFRDNGLLASGSDDKSIRLWNTSSPSIASLLITLLGHASYVSSLAFDANDLLASGSSDHTIRLWLIGQSTGTAQPTILRGHTDRVSCLAFAANGLLASGSDDHSIRLWDITREPSEARLKTLTGHCAGPLHMRLGSPG